MVIAPASKSIARTYWNEIMSFLNLTPEGDLKNFPFKTIARLKDDNVMAGYAPIRMTTEKKTAMTISHGVGLSMRPFWNKTSPILFSISRSNQPHDTNEMPTAPNSPRQLITVVSNKNCTINCLRLAPTVLRNPTSLDRSNAFAVDKLI